MDLETGATREEDTVNRGHLTVIEGSIEHDRDVMDESRDDHFIRRDGKIFAGTHLIIEVVEGEGLDDEARIRQAFRDCVETCGATLLHIHTHKFSPQGVSGVAVLAESHISVHTWPEIGYGAFDVFMCGDAEPWNAVDVLRVAFSAREVRVKELLRGDGVVAAAL
jgi:S-adenosylmethionine decarboxylase